MAVVSLEPQVRLLNNPVKAIVFACFLLVFGNCNGRYSKEKSLKTVFIQDSGDFSFHQDTIYYKDKVFTGVKYQLYPTGDTMYRIEYWNGLEHGITKKWYPNTYLAEDRYYEYGKKEGVHKGWWESGRLKFMFTVSNDEYIGELKEWNMEGLLVKHSNFKNGQEEGSQRTWWDNGKVKANYVVKNGRKYGSIGIKLCKNPYDSLK